MTGRSSVEVNSTSRNTDPGRRHLERFGAGTLTKCLYQFDEPVSPHIAAKQKTVSTLNLLHESKLTIVDPPR